MPTKEELAALELMKEKHTESVKFVDEDLQNFNKNREEQIKISLAERSKLNFLAFTIVGGVLTFSPESLNSLLVAIGLGGLLFTSFIFGFFAQEEQIDLNISNFEDAIKILLEKAKPHNDAYDSMLEDLDKNQKLSHEKVDKYQNEYMDFLKWTKGRPPKFPKRNKFSIGKKYRVIYGMSLHYWVWPY